MNPITRRSFVAGVAAVPVSLWLARTVASDNTPRIRYDARSPQGREMLAVYARAVGLMNRAPKTDPTSWLFQWYTHWVDGSTTKEDAITRIFPAPSPERNLAEEMWSSCQAHGDGHDRNMFLPWHRLFLYYFERIVRGVSGDDSFTLPYWDYSAADPAIRGILPPEFRKQNDPTFGPLFVKNRNPGVNQGNPIHQGQLGDPLATDVLDLCGYEPGLDDLGFCQRLDRGLHGNVHVLVGDEQNLGSVPWAANDPIFWLHHCNIDRLWASWNAAGRNNPAMNQTFVFADETGTRVEANAGDADGLSHFGYSYDRLEQVSTCPTQPPEVVASASERRPTRIAALAAEDRVSLTSSSVEVALEPLRLNTEAPPSFSTRAESLNSGRRWHLLIGDLHAESQPGVLYNVFLNLPPNATEEQRKAHFLGTVNFFDSVSHKGQHEHAHEVTRPEDSTAFRFEVTNLVKRLRAENRLGEKPVLTIEAAGKPTEKTMTVIKKAMPTVGEITLTER